MPIYEYQCTACGEELEKLQKMSDPPLTECPACGKSALQKKVSAAGFRLKGGGWYETDFKGSGRQKNVAKGDSGGPGSGGKDSGSGGGCGGGACGCASGDKGSGKG
ncbi:MAG TPA: zinc ribbon domain-containing protein [Gammaproteobacteria bacterium]|nr:zinc ribbon domain-containing protein [Gammaproteobacteria bacterium]